MPTRPPQHRTIAARSKQDRGREHDKRRTESQPWRAWYGTPAWRALRQATFIRDLYQCQMIDCGKLVTEKGEATCDHIRPHRGDATLFFDPANLQTLCKACHDSAKAREERRGYVIGCDRDGRPRDPSHPWSR